MKIDLVAHARAFLCVSHLDIDYCHIDAVTLDSCLLAKYRQCSLLLLLLLLS